MLSDNVYFLFPRILKLKFPNCFQSFDYLQVQHTPNPEAQDPALVPPLSEHSSL